MTDESDVKLLIAGQARIEKDLEKYGRQLDNYLTQHASKHDTDAALNNSHLLQSSQAFERGVRNEGNIGQLDGRIELLELWRHELLGAMKLVKVAFGTSIISAILTLVALFTLITKTTP